MHLPEGKLTENGEITFAVTTCKGKVVINFGTPVVSLGMSGQQALALASLLKRKVREMRRKKR